MPRRTAVARATAWLAAGVFATFAACNEESSDAPRAGDAADCRLIANRCHPYDDGSNLAHECHETGHDGASPRACTELKARCLQACPPRDPDAGGSGGTTGGTGGSAGELGGDAGQSSGASGGGSGGTATGGTSGADFGGSAGEGGPSIPPTDAGESACEMLGRVCHGVGPGFTEGCHELGHDGYETACQAELGPCLAACVDAGT